MVVYVGCCLWLLVCVDVDCVGYFGLVRLFGFGGALDLGFLWIVFLVVGGAGVLVCMIVWFVDVAWFAVVACVAIGWVLVFALVVA